MKRKKTDRVNGKRKRIKRLPGYPLYPANEDIYNRSTEISEIDLDDPYLFKVPNEAPDAANMKNYLLTGDDLDVPGAELDDDLEEIGSEDEENNYYSISDNR
jgi:hypothetical protein